MTINTADYMTSTLAACCTKFFNWDYDECTGNHPNECVPALYYPDWGVDPARVLQMETNLRI